MDVDRAKVWLKQQRELAALYFRQQASMDLRWSYVAAAGLIVIGAIVNLVLPHGWTVWPVIFCAAILMMIHEASDRNGQGIPPGQVYAFFGMVVAVWMVVAAILSALGPVLIVVGITALAMYVMRGYLRQRERKFLMDERRREGLCVHCGHKVESDKPVCMNCGADPGVNDGMLSSFARYPRTAQQVARARALLKGEAPTATAKRKEQALLQRKHTTRQPGASMAPAAKLKPPKH